MNISNGSSGWANRLNDLRARWMIRKEESTRKEWMPVVQFAQSIKNLPKDALVTMKIDVIEVLREVDHKLNIARSKAGAYRQYTDPSIYREMEAARASVVSHISVIDAEFTRRKIERNNSFPSLFVDAARDLLSEEEFAKIRSLAKSRMNK